LIIVKTSEYMRIPKNWNKMTAAQQEILLVNKYQELTAEVDEVRKLLATVRGGQRVTIPEIDRPDEAILKDPA
jgi:hypothetical protein